MTNTTSSNPMPVSAGIRLKMIFCVIVEPGAGENVDLDAEPGQHKLGEKDTALFPTMFSLAFHYGKGRRIVQLALPQPTLEAAGDGGEFSNL